MKPLIPALLLLAMGTAQAAPIAMEDQSQLKVPGVQAAPQFVPPAESELPDNAFGKMVRQGHALFVDTRRLMPEAVGNGLNCSNCHLDQGRLAHSAPMWGAYPMYPAYRKKNDKVNTFAERIQGCFQFSMNGKPPAGIDLRIIVTNLCVMDFGGPGHQIRVVSLHPGVTFEEVQDNTGFPLLKSAQLRETAHPTAEQLALIRRLDPHDYRAAAIKGNPSGIRSA